MRIILTFCFILISYHGVFSQENIQFSASKNSVQLPFKLVNNLIILPMNVNGTNLNFLVDTGVKETILFGLDENRQIPLFDTEKVKFKGLGSQAPVEGMKAYGNTLSVAGLEFKNQELFIILDQEFNFSSVLGIEVNGIIGYHFFSQGIVKIDYNKKRIIIYNPKKYTEKKVLSKFVAFDFQLEEAKPYITMQVQIDGKMFDSKCLIDSGNSDGLWLFKGKSDNIVIPERNFEDYLGRGFSGDVYGKKAKINTLSLGNHRFQNVVTAFPDEHSFVNLKMVDNRLGSIGGEFLRRFNVIFDYRNQKLYLQKSRYYGDKFRYNITGITIHHVGLQYYNEEIKTDGLYLSHDLTKTKSYIDDLRYNFKLIPLYEILTIRQNSTAEKVGLQSGDQIIKVNGKNASRLSLEKINQLLKIDGQKDVTMIILRKEKQIMFRFKIEDLL